MRASVFSFGEIREGLSKKEINNIEISVKLRYKICIVLNPTFHLCTDSLLFLFSLACSSLPVYP